MVFPETLQLQKGGHVTAMQNRTVRILGALTQFTKVHSQPDTQQCAVLK